MRGDLCRDCERVGTWRLVRVAGEARASAVRLCDEHAAQASDDGSLVDLVDDVRRRPGITATELGRLRPEVGSLHQRVSDMVRRGELLRDSTRAPFRLYAP